MSTKEIVTLKEIEHDIKNSLKTSQEIPESSYRKWAIPGGIWGVLMAILSIFQLKIALLGLFIVIIVAVFAIIIEALVLKHKRKSFCIDDYEVAIAALSHTEEEHYKQSRGVRVRRGRKVNNYTLWFENKRSWRVPKHNYTWSKEHEMSDLAIFQSSHRGDIFIVVINKISCNIVMAYNTEFFEYKV